MAISFLFDSRRGDVESIVDGIWGSQILADSWKDRLHRLGRNKQVHYNLLIFVTPLFYMCFTIYYLSIVLLGCLIGTKVPLVAITTSPLLSGNQTWRRNPAETLGKYRTTVGHPLEMEV